VKEIKFKPLKADNEKMELRTIPLPIIASYKMDGIRCLFYKGKMYTSSLKYFQNTNVLTRFEHLRKLSEDRGILIDGELLAKSLPFNELSGLTRQLDKELPDDLYFYAFDCIVKSNFTKPFRDRLVDLQGIKLIPVVKIIEQYEMIETDKVKQIFEEALAWGCDGLILRNPNSRYKFGRGTVKEALIYKLKPFETFDAQIIEVIQGTKVDPNAEKTINELGRSVTSKKKGDRILIDKACDFVVLYEGKELKVSIAMTDEEKEEVWKNRKDYIGRWIEYKGMLVGAKDLPRHPVFLRMRDDKEE